MCKKSESIANLAKSLALFNGEVSRIEKDSTNPHFRNKYASLDTIIDEIRPILHKYGLSIIQMPGGDGEVFTMTTMLLHESGEWIESDPIVMRPVKNDPQGIGSCATYARRYSLAAFLSLNTGEDDDGNAASGDPHKPQHHAAKPPQAKSESRDNTPAAAFNAKSRVINMMHELKWDWNTLGEFASEVLGRKIVRVLKDIATEEEWRKVEEQLTIVKEAS